MARCLFKFDEKDVIEAINNLFISKNINIEELDANSGKRLVSQLQNILSRFEQSLRKEKRNITPNKGGRPCKLSNTQVTEAKISALNSEVSVADICKEYGISLRTYYRRVYSSDLRRKPIKKKRKRRKRSQRKTSFLKVT